VYYSTNGTVWRPESGTGAGEFSLVFQAGLEQNSYNIPSETIYYPLPLPPPGAHGSSSHGCPMRFLPEQGLQASGELNPAAVNPQQEATSSYVNTSSPPPQRGWLIIHVVQEGETLWRSP
jgi:hypothetical protein